ncbi:MAG: DOMON domain-containing protein [Candidatus Thorarchaeota archaeon]
MSTSKHTTRRYLLSGFLIALFIFSPIILDEIFNFDLVSSSEFYNFSDNMQIASSKITNKVEQDQYDTSIPYVGETNVTIDGLIGENEYTESYYDTRSFVTVYWEHNNDNLTIAIDAPAKGWVAFGIIKDSSVASSVRFFPQQVNVSIIMGGVLNGEAYASDKANKVAYTLDNDTNLGGQDNILDYAATENSTNTIFEFIIPMNSTDTLDPVIQVNKTYTMFFGYSLDDDVTVKHEEHSPRLKVFIRPPLEIYQTQMTIISPVSVVQGDLLKLQATLKDDQGNPIPNYDIEFYRSTQFGELIIDTIQSNSTGGAEMSYNSTLLKGNVTFGATFNEKIDIIQGKTIIYKKSAIETSVYFEYVETIEDRVRDVFFIPASEKCCSGGLFYLLVLRDFLFYMALFTIWGLYLFNVVSIVRIRFDKGKEKEKITENNSMEDF